MNDGPNNDWVLIEKLRKIIVDRFQKYYNIITNIAIPSTLLLIVFKSFSKAFPLIKVNAIIKI